MVVVVVVGGVYRRHLRVDASAVVTSDDVSDSGSQHDDVERLLPTVHPPRRPAGYVDNDDDELHRRRTVTSGSRLDFDTTRHSVTSRRCVVETDEIDSERVLFIIHRSLVLCHVTLCAMSTTPVST